MLTVLLIIVLLQQVVGQCVIDGVIPLNLTSYNGGWFSPLFPEKYPPGSYCEWKIIGPDSDARVLVEFEGFKLKREDSLSFYDGLDEQAPLIVVHSGDGVPPPLTSSQSNMFVVFDVDSDGEEGFWLKYSADKACQEGGYRNITDSPGYIDSMFYPEMYGPLSDCQWEVTAPEDSVIMFRFDEFALEGYCQGDYVLFEENSQTLAYFCKDFPPSDFFISSTNAVTVSFATDDRHESFGFHLYYEFLECVPTCPTQQPPNPGDVTTQTIPSDPPITSAITTAPGTTTTTTPDIGTKDPFLTALFMIMRINGTFETTDGSNLSPDCVSAYQSKLRQAQGGRMSDTNQNFIPYNCTHGPELFLEASDTSLISMGSAAFIQMEYSMAAFYPRTFGAHQDCAQAVALDLEPHSTWNQPILPTPSGCPNVAFTTNQFNTEAVNWRCPD